MKVNTIAAENLINSYNNADAKLETWYSENNAQMDRINAFRYAQHIISLNNEDCLWMVKHAESYGLKADAARWASETVKELKTIDEFNYAAFLSTNDISKWVN